jgi:hypothetical protein
MKYKIIFSIAMIFLVLSIVNVFASSPKFLYPEDLSWKSGLIKETTIYKEDGITPLQKSINYWNSKYPFGNPAVNINYGLQDRINDPTGFKAKLIRTWTGDKFGAKYSQNLVSTSYLEGTVTIKYGDNYDGSLNSLKTYAQKSDFDSYGNVKTSYNLGYTGNNNGLSKIFNPVYNVRDPKFHDIAYTVPFNPSITNFQGTLSADTESSTGLKDTTTTYTKYLYETYTQSLNEIDWVSTPEMYGWVNLPVETKTKDYLGRSLGTTAVDYISEKSNVNSCAAQTQYTAFALCGNNYCPWIVPAYSINVPGEINYKKSGSSEIDLLALNDVATRTRFKYDACGNPVDITVESKYIKFPESKDKSEIIDYGADIYRKSAIMTYVGESLKPTEVKVVNPTDPDHPLESPYVTKKANYYSGFALKQSINERDVATTVDYDELGRLIGVWGPYDGYDSNPSKRGLPSVRYEYLEESTFNGAKNKILAQVKRDDNTYSSTYYFYDGMGRNIQTQSLDSDGTFIVSGSLIDGTGRVLREYRSLRINDNDFFGNFDKNFYLEGFGSDSEYKKTTWIEYTYDPLGRVKTIKDTADNSVVTKNYNIENGYDLSIEEDPKENIRTYWNDARGDLVGVGLPEL